MDAPMPADVEQAWTRFFEQHPDIEPGRDLYPEVFAEGWLFPLQRMKETEAMIRMARTIQPKVVMEIGTDKGGSFFHWIHGLPTVHKAIGIEIRGVPWGDAFAKFFSNTVDILRMDASSYNKSTELIVRGFLGDDPIDCLFIDGDKARVADDFKAYAPMVRKGGLIFIHDITDEIEMRRFFKSLTQYRTEEIYDVSEYDAIHKRELHGIPPRDAYEQWYRIWKKTSCGVGVVHV